MRLASILILAFASVAHAQVVQPMKKADPATKEDIAVLLKRIDALENRIAALEGKNPVPVPPDPTPPTPVPDGMPVTLTADQVKKINAVAANLRKYADAAGTTAFDPKAMGMCFGEIADVFNILTKTVPPTPTPTPTPVPLPRAVALTFVVKSPDAASNAMLNDQAFRAWLKGNGIGVYRIKTDVEQAANPRFAGVADRTIAIQSADHALIGTLPMTTADAAKAFVSKYLGK